MRYRMLAIAAGGVLGSAVRWGVLATFSSGEAIPWPVLVVNVAGSFVLGVVLAEEWAHPRSRLWLHDAGGIGFCGGLTTFSTFAVEIADRLRDGRVAVAVLYAALSVGLSVGGVVAGAALAHQVRAVDLPLEEQP